MARYEDLPYRTCVGMMLINKDGLVFVHELEAYAAARVAELSGGAQHPVAGRPPTIRLFPIAKP